MQTPFITDIQRFSLQDGPGIRTTVYLKGCPLHCPWCHNPETIQKRQQVYFHESRCLGCGECSRNCPSGALSLTRTADRGVSLATDPAKCTSCLTCVESCLGRARETVGREVELDDIVREALADEIFFRHSGGGVTISGGEPLLFPEFLLALAQALKEKSGVHLAVETSFTAAWEKIERLLAYVDLFIIDVKTLSSEKYREVIGGSLELVLFNIEKVLRARKEVRVHIPVIPGFNDTPADVEAYQKYLGGIAPLLSGVDILPFHSFAAGKYQQLGLEYAYRGVNDLGNEMVLPLFNALKTIGVRQVTVGGVAGTGKRYADSGPKTSRVAPVAVGGW